MTEKRKTVEKVGGDFGFRVVWEVLDHWADVTAYEITGRDGNTERPRFGDNGDLDEDDYLKACKYLEGYVKWDGCSQFIFEEGNYQHLCGGEGYDNHIQLLTYIWRRAFELMGRDPWKEWTPEVWEENK